MNKCAMKESSMNRVKLTDSDRNASTLAREICSPLNTIKGTVVYLKENYADDKILIEFTRIMDVEISRIENAIARLHSTPFSKPHVGTTENPSV
jgi:nitrogen-specific signal transduction histidine kinase